ncbi:MAG: glucosamine-6-phosphate deaminase [Lachnospiraceae bacterium]|nr:glucosamine-6-phosphate deaminase [Lachnospiraceae bacterium]
MRFIKASNYEDMSRKAANIIGAQIILKPDSVLGLATGSTPIGTYANLVKDYENGDLDFAKIISVNLDEYKGLTRDNDQSYYYFMNHHLFRHVNIDANNTHLADGTEADADKACAQFEQIIKATGGVDLQLLGLGHNGHIGFNEPSDVFMDKTFCVTLDEMTIKANQRFFASYEDVPKQAYTMGIGTIMAAKKILIVVSGEDKSSIIKEAFFGSVTPKVQASILQFHPDVTIVGDEAAFSKI